MFGVSRQTINNWENGKKIPDTKLQMVLNFLGVDEADGGQTEFSQGNVPLPCCKHVETRPRLPIAATLGNIKEYYDGARKDECDHKPVVKQFSHYHFTMIVNTDCMSPYIETGDVIACAEIGETIDYGCVYVVDTDGGALIKRVYQCDGGDSLKLTSQNPIYQDFFIEKSKVNGMYRVVGLFRIGI